MTDPHLDTLFQVWEQLFVLEKVTRATMDDLTATLMWVAEIPTLPVSPTRIKVNPEDDFVELYFNASRSAQALVVYAMKEWNLQIEDDSVSILFSRVIGGKTRRCRVVFAEVVDSGVLCSYESCTHILSVRIRRK